MKLTLKTSIIFFQSALAVNMNAQVSKFAIVGVHSDTPDGFTFVAGENLSSGTKFYFTHEEYEFTRSLLETLIK